MSELLTPIEILSSPGVREALAKSPLFAALPRGLAEDVAAASTLRSVRRGELLWDHGSPSQTLAVVASGRIKCWMRGHDARQWVNVVARAGEVCGLPACMDGGPHTCNAEPLERSQVVLVPSSALRNAIERSPAFAVLVARTLAGDLRHALSTCEDMTLRSPVERLARFLVAESNAGVVELRENQTQLAGQLGTVREVVGRGLRMLEARGVIVRTGRVVRILRPADLEAVARGA